jgi:hypothetical protein
MKKHNLKYGYIDIQVLSIFISGFKGITEQYWCKLPLIFRGCWIGLCVGVKKECYELRPNEIAEFGDLNLFC